MCGISGIFDWKKLEDADVIVEKMLDSQHKEGPTIVQFTAMKKYF